MRDAAMRHARMALGCAEPKVDLVDDLVAVRNALALHGHIFNVALERLLPLAGPLDPFSSGMRPRIM
jgi:hypothetical protein